MDLRPSKPRAGKLFVVSGPSGVGKGTLMKRLCARFPAIRLSISVTTRAPRVGEEEGREYFFRDEATFRTMIEEGALLEYAQFVNGRFYGTPRSFVEEQVAKGHDVVLEIDVQGAMQVKEHWPDGVFIFILPPSLAELRKRLENRQTESAEAISERVSIAAQEISRLSSFDYAVINDDLDLATERLTSVFVAEHCRVTESLLKEILDGTQQVAQ